MPHVLANWEAQLLEFERRTGKKVDPDLKVAVLVSMAPGDLKRHLQLNASSLKTFEATRAE
eukprot:5925807-Amphidinium_carterae.1